MMDKPYKIIFTYRTHGKGDLHKEIIEEHEMKYALAAIDKYVKSGNCIKGTIIDADNNIIKEESNISLVRKLWSEFGEISMYPTTERIKSQFLHFESGTCRNDICDWFENTFNVNVNEDLLSA